MPQPLSAPWLLRFTPTVLEVRLLVDEGGPGSLSLTWRAQPDRHAERVAPVECRPLEMAGSLSLARLGRGELLADPERR